MATLLMNLVSKSILSALDVPVLQGKVQVRAPDRRRGTTAPLEIGKRTEELKGAECHHVFLGTV